MDPCKESLPGVINNAMLEKCVRKQFPSGEAGRLAREEGIPLDEVECLRLEYLNILRIDHLWMLTSLTKLSLTQNYIEKIENLETLLNLKDLDLSFNKISKIENLEQLVNLEILSFYENRITTIENMDALKKLSIFSIGKNYIDDRDNVLYLRRFKNLSSLNMAGNPCVEDESFRIYVTTFLPQIQYYEYKMVQDVEREMGNAIYSHELDQLGAAEAIEREIQEKKEAEEAEALLHSESFVEYLGSDHLFRSLFQDDVEGNALMLIGEEMEEYYDEYQEQFSATCKQLFEYGQVQYKIRKSEVDQFTQSVEGAKLTSQQESIKHMETFLEQKAAIFYAIRKLQEDIDNNEITVNEYSEKIDIYAEEYATLIHKTWKVLMNLELTLYEQLEETNQSFEQTLTEMVNTFIETAQGHFTNLRNLEQMYMEGISEVSNRYMTTANVTEDFQMPEELKEYMYDKEALNNALGATHDIHMQVIDNREDLLIKRAREWLNNVATNLQRDEVKRNRAKVLEINHFLDIQREEFEELHNTIVGPAIDPDITAALS